MNDLTPILPNEMEQIEAEFQLLLKEYLQSRHRKKVELIQQAYEFALKAHDGMRRNSGEPYILHPIAVARIVCNEIGLGSTSICAALLHDVVEDTHYTNEDISTHFGEKIASIVDGLTKISGGIFGERASGQAETLRKLLLTMSEDIRVILIKMADRLHNMRTLSSLPPNKQYKIAGETLYIYAPLAYRLGLFTLKSELEDLSFRYEHPIEYKKISDKIADSAEVREKIYRDFTNPIVERLEEAEIDFEIKARVKSVYSIWNKMKNKNIPFEEVYDLYAVRIIFTPKRENEEKLECWRIYSIITDIYNRHPERTRDWISAPKSNGYRALHLTAMGNDGSWIEVQIRSKQMDEVAERGLAAHWKYKQGVEGEESDLDSWLKTIKDILVSPEPNALDLLDTIKLNLFSSEIFLFTPRGDLMTLPKSATALDFAFMLHSDMGYHCIAAKVNHKLVPLSHVLESGDQVEILTSSSQTPQAEWINFVTTAKAKSKLVVALRRARRKIVQNGETLIKEFLNKNRIDTIPHSIDKLLKHYALDSAEELFFKIGSAEIELNKESKRVVKDRGENLLLRYFKRNTPPPVKSDHLLAPAKIDRKESYLLSGSGSETNYTLAPCCKPILGDDVLGYIDDNEQVIVHKRECPVALQLKSSFGSRIVSTCWDGASNQSFLATIEINGIDDIGVLNTITGVISSNLLINIRSLNINSNDGLFTGIVGLSVRSTQDLKQLCRALKQIKQVKQVKRIIG